MGSLSSSKVIQTDIDIEHPAFMDEFLFLLMVDVQAQT
jgi:hypothetical protein